MVRRCRAYSRTVHRRCMSSDRFNPPPPAERRRRHVFFSSQRLGGSRCARKQSRDLAVVQLVFSRFQPRVDTASVGQKCGSTCYDRRLCVVYGAKNWPCEPLIIRLSSNRGLTCNTIVGVEKEWEEICSSSSSVQPK